MAYQNQVYTKFRLISYEIPCGYAKEIKERDEYHLNRNNLDNNYLPIPNGLSDDARRRLQRLAGAVHLANEKVKANFGNNGVEPGILKVFVVPEFYFRPASGVENSYTEAEKKKVLEAVEGMFQHADFKHWLFVLGTVVWSSKIGKYFNELTSDFVRQNTSEEEAIENKDIVLNSAILLKGGDPLAPFYTLEKQNYAYGDRIDKTKDPKANTYKQFNCRTLLGKWKARKNSLVKIDNLEVGLEICRDHATECHVLKKTYNYKKTYIDKEAKMPDLHFMIAAGCPAINTSIAAKENGHFIRLDASDKSSGFPITEVRKVTKQVINDYQEVDRVKYEADKIYRNPDYNEFEKNFSDKITQSELVAESVKQDNNHAFIDVEIPDELKIQKILNAADMVQGYVGNLLITANTISL